MIPASDCRIEICLPVRGAQVAFLSIPHAEIEYLTTRPFKWMRFVMFSICGARGDLSATPGGPPVDYESTLLDEARYYYKPSEHFSFVDPYVIDDRMSATDQTPRKRDFRQKVMARDGQTCIFTGKPGRVCDAAHLIPRSKGNEYISRVIQIRAHCYPTQPPLIPEVDVAENGMLLYKDAHQRFGIGEVALLKTPNFAMSPTDIPRIRQAPPHPDGITLHQLMVDHRYDPALTELLLGPGPNPSGAYSNGFHVDASFPIVTQPSPPPPAIILDFMYGAAAYALWKSETLHAVVADYFTEHYRSALSPPDKSDDSSGSDDTFTTASDDSLYTPSSETEQDDSSEEEDVLTKAMDEMSKVMMFLSGVTPQEAAKAREKRMKEKELAAQEASRTKVMEWKRTSHL